MTRIHDLHEVDAQAARRERLELRARLSREAGYDPVWGLLKPPLAGPDPADFPAGVGVVARSSGRGARSRPRDRMLGKRAA